MAEEWKLTLNNRWYGMSANEYDGGSFFYAEWIDNYSNSKSFKLWHSIVDIELNKRYAWYAIAMESLGSLDEEWFNIVWMVGFTSDWYIESNWINRWSSTSDEFWGAFYKRPTGTYVNWAIFWWQLLGITADKIDRITTITDLWGTNLVSNPWLTSDTDWTVWAWWATSASWSTHTTGVNTLTQTLTLTASSKYRIVVKASWATTGSCEIKLWTEVVWTLTTTTDSWFMGIWNNGVWETSLALTFTPTTWYNWTIEYVKVQKYDPDKLLDDNITITSYTSHPLCLWQWDIYIGSWNSLDIVNTTLWDVRTVNIIDPWYYINSITQQWWNIIVWANNWKDSKQYYWNWVDKLASEVIDRPWNNIVSVITDETKNYAIINNNWDRRVYIVSWYQRQLIAKNVFNWRTIEWGREEYNVNKRFNFLINWQNRTALLNDKLYVNAYGWIYVYGNNIVWMQPSWSKPIKFLTSTTVYALQNFFGNMYMSNRKSSINYISSILEYKYTTTGYLVTSSIIWDNISTKKALNKLSIWFKNIDSTIGNIKIYAIVDDDYFWRYKVTNVTTRPVVWDTYNIGKNTVWEIIAIENNWTTGMITFKTTNNTANYPWNALSSITKVTGSWQASISTGTLFDNMCLIKTITSDQQSYWEELVFWSSFVDTHMPDWHKIQLVIELNSNNSNVSPEIFDISLLSDIVDSDV